MARWLTFYQSFFLCLGFVLFAYLYNGMQCSMANIGVTMKNFLKNPSNPHLF